MKTCKRKYSKNHQDAKYWSDLSSACSAGGGGGGFNFIFLPALEVVLGDEILTMVVKGG
jgi:hypothetical protein